MNLEQIALVAQQPPEVILPWVKVTSLEMLSWQFMHAESQMPLYGQHTAHSMLRIQLLSQQMD